MPESADVNINSISGMKYLVFSSEMINIIPITTHKNIRTIFTNIASVYPFV